MKFKKLIFIVAIILLSKDIIASDYDINFNTGDTSYVPAYSQLDDDTVGARISLWDITTNTRLNCLNIFNKEYEKVKDYKFLSDLTKAEIKDYNCQIPYEIQQVINEPYTSTITYDGKIDLPHLIKIQGESGETFTKQITEFFKIKENVDNLCYLLQAKDYNEIETNNTCILIEPLLINRVSKGFFIWEERHIECYTAAEIGLLTYNNIEIENSKTHEHTDRFYSLLPFSLFKNNIGALKKVPAYDFENKKNITKCQTKDSYKDMIESLGCLELVFKGGKVATKSEIKEATPSEVIKPEIVEPTEAVIEYYTNMWVVTSVNIRSERGFPYQSKTPGTGQDLDAKSNCQNGKLAKITYNFDTDNNAELSKNKYEQELAIPEGEEAVSWVKWKTPSEPCVVEIKITTNSADAVPEDEVLYIEVIDPTDNGGNYPPPKKATDRNDGFRVPTLATGSWDIDTQKSLTWLTYNYKWHEYWVVYCTNERDGDRCQQTASVDEYEKYGTHGGYDYEEEYDDEGEVKSRKKVYWHSCDTCSCNYGDVSENHTCKPCSFVKEDWGWVEWEAVEHTLSINITDTDLRRSTESPNTNNSDYSIKSGYGVELKVNATCEYKKDGKKKEINGTNIRNAIVPPQTMEMYMPEYDYEKYVIMDYHELDTGYEENATFELPTCPYSQFGQKCHFTPIWYPNGKYVVGIKVSQCFCPAGMLYICVRDVGININGSAYDDWHIAPEIN